MAVHPTYIQWVLGVVTLMSALLVILGRNPIVSAVSLMATLFTTGLLYFSIEANFIAVVQILIYAGAISVLIVFIVMLLDLRPARVVVPGRSPIYVVSIVASAIFFVASLLCVLPVLNRLGIDALGGQQDPSLAQAPEAISLQLLSKNMIPFQVTALLLLAAVMGVVVLGKKNMLSERKGDENK